MQLVSSFKYAIVALRSAQGAEGEAVKQHVRTALSLIQSLVVDAELEARLKELQPLKLQTLHDIRAGAVADGKSLGEVPLNGLKIRCALPMHLRRMHVCIYIRCLSPTAGSSIDFQKEIMSLAMLSQVPRGRLEWCASRHTSSDQRQRSYERKHVYVRTMGYPSVRTRQRS